MNNLLELLEAKQELDNLINKKINKLGLSESFITNMLSKRGEATPKVTKMPYNPKANPVKTIKMLNVQPTGTSSIVNKGKLALCNFRYKNDPKMLNYCKSKISNV